MPLRPPIVRPFLALACAALASLGALIAAAPARAAQQITVEQARGWNTAANDPAKAAGIIPELRAYLADPDPAYEGLVRQLLLAALITTKQPGPQIVLAADSTGVKVPEQRRGMFYAQVAEQLLARDLEPKATLRYARWARDYVPADGDPRMAPLRAMVTGTLGRAYLANGQSDSALSLLREALPAHPESSIVLTAIGGVHEKRGSLDEAERWYLRAASVYLARDTSANAPLRKLWTKRHGSLAGLDAKLATSRKASMKAVALDARSETRAAPNWTLQNLAGESVSMSQFKGKVVVLDFWGSWCGPCRQELPIFQRVYEKYRSKGVAFVGINWEQPGNSADVRLKKAKDYIEANKYTFPVVVDPDRLAVDPYQITGFPTVFLVDKSGSIRYRNTGVAEGIETILQDQIESLLE